MCPKDRIQLKLAKYCKRKNTCCPMCVSWYLLVSQWPELGPSPPIVHDRLGKCLPFSNTECIILTKNYGETGKVDAGVQSIVPNIAFKDKRSQRGQSLELLKWM
jgi:hypothetical protein